MAVDAVEKAIYSLLTNDANVSGLVSTRVFPIRIPQGASMPAITYEQETGPREHTLDGPVGMVPASFAINCWSTTYAQARMLADYTRICLDGYAGTTGSQKIHVAMLGNESDLFEQAPDVLGTRRHGKQLTFTIWFEEATS